MFNYDHFSKQIILSLLQIDRITTLEESRGANSAPTLRRGNEMTAQTELKPIDTLIPYNNNARTHSKKQIKQIAASIEKFGFTNPVLVDENDTILAGHGRVAAARLLGLKKVPVVLITHLNMAEKRAYVLADNRLAEQAGWDKQILAIELQGLVDLDFDVALTGFDIPQVDLIIGEFSPDNQDDDDEPTLPERSAGPSVARPGDVFVLGDHRLICGDALSAEVFETLMQGAKAAVCFTDPPYNVKIGGHVSGLGKTSHREFAMASGEMSDQEFADFLGKSFSLIAASCAPGTVAFVCMDWRHVAETIVIGTKAFGDLLNLCVWNKTNAGMGSLYRSQHELVLVLRIRGDGHRNNIELGKHGRHRSNVWTYRGVNSFGSDRMEDLAAHPTVKPVNLVADALLDVSKRGDVVLDPFGGSGTTLLAAHKTGRRARLIEIDPGYCDLIIRRFENHTGKQAKLAGTGETFEELSEQRLGTETGPLLSSDSQTDAIGECQ
jgi:DNA modification methylase